MRKLLTPKWLGLHALAVLLIAAFLLLGWWQIQRGEAGNARSWGYAFQWPAFAIFVVYMWIKMAREELNPKPDPPRQASTAASASGTTAASSTVVLDEEDDDEPEVAEQLEEYNRWLAELNSRAERVGR